MNKKSNDKFDPIVLPEYSSGICGDGAAILKDGVMMEVDEIIETLKNQQQAVKLLLWQNQILKQCNQG